jgi:hypothetical protein
VEPEEMAIARQWKGVHVSVATNVAATIEQQQEAVFIVRFVLSVVAVGGWAVSMKAEEYPLVETAAEQ